MIPLVDVQAEVLRSLIPLAPVTVPLEEALGLVLAAPVVATEPVPPFANTAMDGYAVRATDTAGASSEEPVRLRVVGDLPAGHAPTVRVGPGDAIRIMTGAPIPEGADAIVMVERTARDGDDGVLVHLPAGEGDHLRPAGGDVVAGQLVFEAGRELGPAHLGVIASLGLGEVSVFPRVRVGVLSTGDELLEGPGELAPGQIRDSNRPMLLAMLRAAGADAVNLGIARDDEQYVERVLVDALASCDAVITSGGVSVGDYDVVKAVLDRLGVLQWWQVAIRPAKPFAFGLLRGVPLFGLPGNPVSSHVSFELFARPALRKMSGHVDLYRREVDAIALSAMPRRADDKLHLDRVVVRYEGGRYLAERSGAQASNALAAMALANGLALLPDGDGPKAGDTIRVMLLD
ncbi:MAG TPA: gephyrin-like molybdotransferase Glp [Acidimicrobiia bacterium]